MAETGNAIASLHLESRSRWKNLHQTSHILAQPQSLLKHGRNRPAQNGRRCEIYVSKKVASLVRTSTHQKLQASRRSKNATEQNSIVYRDRLNLQNYVDMLF